MMTFTDDTGRRVALPQTPRRIVTLAPSCTENLFAIGAGALVVGVTTADDYPPAGVARLPRVGNFYQPVAERIRALRPDLILVESETVHRADMDALQVRLGDTPLYALSAHRYADVPRHLLRLGEITGHTREAKKQADEMTQYAAFLARQYQGPGVRKTPVFVQIDNAALYAAGPGSLIDDLIRLAGGINIVRGTNPYPLVSKETLLVADPTVYLFTVTVPPGSRAHPTPPPIDPALRSLTAVKNQRVVALDADLLTRPTPRLLAGLILLASVLHRK